MVRPASSAPSASAAQAALEVGCAAATSAGSAPDARSPAPGSAGSSVAGGSPSRLCEWVTSAGLRLTGRQQVLAGADDALGHADLGELHVGARVVGLLDPDLAVDLQHAVVVAEHVPGDRPGERVLGVGVDVHLDHAVGQRLADLRLRRARTAVEDEVERLGAVPEPELLRDDLLALLE